MSTGLLALLDDIAGLARMSAASLDDISAQAARAGVKAAGVVVDDAAVTPRYVTGFAASRELPIVWKIAVGSVKNKLLYLLPLALVLSFVAPWSISVLLMLGGAYLCYEGAEKVWHAIHPPPGEEGHEPVPGHPAPGNPPPGNAAPPAGSPATPLSPGAPAASGVAAAKRHEDARVRSAIQTDFILSAEIMALTLASLTTDSVVAQAVILAVVGLGLTALVYGGVALIVKADDVGVALAANPRPVTSLLGLRRLPETREPSGADHALAPVTQAIGRGLVRGMPPFLRLLGIVGTAAMLWVGGGILLHGMETFGLALPEHWVEAAAHAVAALVPAVTAAAASWMVTAALSGLLGLAVGSLLIPFAEHLGGPVLAWAGGLFGRKPQAGAETGGGAG
ncbi:putative membrane spanning protein [Roseomonas mucosa]|uniref:DUF808 domain-containing protein n=1 Tax=Roseomonas TaxID=125216 RepID=UPI0002D512F5|nr:MULTISPECIES: DUF808 domain-containing protein [Roseomonas]MCG7350749.1 DUF808 domain-containing protein [Roseomonas mucosa]MCG7356212.1 DUF808 domain-containing protein [Roseomonas mucosa]MDT8288572.1 DUF808 domain-containing protein [Roseomonas mucosa]MDT8293586.1 DUF808 domain-containing protein [Roseomonas mucosa]MDT8314245.1 DUF808 domain-containing protein [Roseomonas mucosa]